MGVERMPAEGGRTQPEGVEPAPKPKTKRKKKPQPNGRPPAMTPEVIEKLEEAFAWGCSDVEACLWAEIAPATLYKWQETHPEFSERKAQLKDKPIMLARKSVVGALERDPKLSLDYLARKRKAEFSVRSEHTGKDGKDLLPTPILGGESNKPLVDEDKGE
jgi:hypothetical protein